jgi:UDP-N-acetylglucosamine--N-acetylmuramyl-(pentapeptide) pyrophosphoryl-undecaprenol N-acetylglucosamine transferase
VSGGFVLAAGGTGGHLFPAEAVARLLVAEGGRVHLLTDRRAAGGVGAFAAAVPGVEIAQIRAGRFDGGPLHAACGLAELALGTLQARRLLRRLMPDAAIGFGGYPSVPTMLAAAQLGLPILIHEQNAVLGRANRLLAPRARRIATGFPDTAGLRPADRARAVQTGNPVRPAIRAIGGSGYVPPAPGQPIELLVLGGSQGARVFSEIVPPALAALPAELRTRLRLSQQARPEDRARVTAEYERIGIAAEIDSFFTDVPDRLCRAHLAICRAGASTVAELAVAGRPALLVPYPHAMDDHQAANAAQFAAAGGGWVAAEDGLTPARLAERLAALLADPSGLAAAAAAARVFARDDAAERLTALAVELATGGAGGTLERAA